jgi:hypothetical protein
MAACVAAQASSGPIRAPFYGRDVGPLTPEKSYQEQVSVPRRLQENAAFCTRLNIGEWEDGHGELPVLVKAKT